MNCLPIRLRPVEIVLFLIALCGVARAQEVTAESASDSASESEIEKEILVLATRIQSDLKRTGATITVVSEADRQYRQARSVAEAIRPVPGVFVSRGGPSGGPTSVFLRGAGSNQTVVMVDGVQVNDPTLGGQFNFFDLGLENTGRIEVLRGSASSAWGSEAMGGVGRAIRASRSTSRAGASGGSGARSRHRGSSA